MDAILDRLFLGSLDDGEHATLPLTCVINLTIMPYTNKTVTVYHRHILDEIWLQCQVWDGLVEELRYLLFRRREHVLVHCRLGKSRAPTLVAAYLVSCGMTPAAALAFIKSKRSLVDPAPEIWRSMVAWAEDL